MFDAGSGHRARSGGRRAVEERRGLGRRRRAAHHRDVVEHHDLAHQRRAIRLELGHAACAVDGEPSVGNIVAVPPRKPITRSFGAMSTCASRYAVLVPHAGTICSAVTFGCTRHGKPHRGTAPIAAERGRRAVPARATHPCWRSRRRPGPVPVSGDRDHADPRVAERRVRQRLRGRRRASGAPAVYVEVTYEVALGMHTTADVAVPGDAGSRTRSTTRVGDRRGRDRSRSTR